MVKANTTIYSMSLFPHEGLDIQWVLSAIQGKKAILGHLKWSTTGKISVPRALRLTESKILCQQILLERDLKEFLQLLSPLKIDSALLGLMRVTIKLCIIYFFSRKMYSSHCKPLLWSLPFPPCVSKCCLKKPSNWDVALTKPNCDFQKSAVSLATSVSPS